MTTMPPRLRSRLFTLISFFTLISNGTKVYADPLNVVTTLPEFAEMARTVGGKSVNASSILKGIEDPHLVDTTPALILKLMKADLVVSAGLGLESSWLNRALAKTGRPVIQRGGPGYLELGESIEALEKRSGSVDRSQGDIHAQGNPHFYLSPSAMALSASGLLKALILLRPNEKQSFEAGHKAFVSQMTEVEKKTRNLLAPITGRKVMEYHQEFVYFFALYGLKSMGAIEEKPGLSPSSGRLAEVAMQAKSEKVAVALGGTFAPRQHLRRFTELAGVPHMIVPTVVNPSSPDAASIEAVQMTIANALVKAAR